MSRITKLLFPGLIVTCFLLVVGVTIFKPLPAEVQAAGPPVFVDDSSNPLAGVPLRLLCYDSPTMPPFADFMETTTASGTVPLPANCDYVAALQLHHTQPSGKPEHGPAFWIYTTSFSPGTTMPVTATGQIMIKEENTLVLFKVVVSLGWDVTADSSYLAEFRAGLSDASQYLYDISEGQAAFGPVTVHHDGRHWQGADIRVLPTNDHRPAAFAGGIVPERVEYTSIGGASTDFAPANINLGRYWNGTDAHSGLWSDRDGYATMIHEWGHYALFLFDEYVQASGYSTYCICDTLPSPAGCGYGDLDGSIMAYHYGDISEFWHSNTHGDPMACTDSHQYFTHSQSDWKMLENWHTILGISFPSPTLIPLLSPPDLVAGPPVGLVGHLYGRTPNHTLYLPVASGTGLPGEGAAQADVSVFLNDPVAITQTLPSDVYLLEDGTAGVPTRIIHQGRLLDPSAPDYLVGDLEFWGVYSADRMRVYVDQYATSSHDGQRFTYPEPLNGNDAALYDGQEIEVLPNEWGVTIDMSQELTSGLFTKLIVDFATPDIALNNVTARLCVPEAAVGCAQYWDLPMNPTDGIGYAWQVAFEPAPGEAELPTYGVIQIHDEDYGDVLTWFQRARGVGPAHIHGDAPLRDGLVMVDTNNPVPFGDECNHVLISPAKNVAALTASLGQTGQMKDVAGLVGRPLDIDILMATNAVCQYFGDDDHDLATAVIMTFFYSQEEIDRLEISEFNLRLLRFDKGNSLWEEVYTTDQDTELNWLTSLPMMEDGIYAIGYVP